MGNCFSGKLIKPYVILNYRYVRCIKPNTKKASNHFDDQQVLTQLRYLGMLDIIRIRREGFPVHMAFLEFIHRYRCLLKKSKIPADPQIAVKFVLQTLNMPEMEWQIGKSKVFLRDKVHDPMEDKRKFILNGMALIIQKMWRGTVKRKEFLKKKKAAIMVQKYFRGHRQKIAFLHHRRAAITIQAFVRGMFAREVAAALREMRRVEEEMKRKEMEEEVKRKLEEEKNNIEQNNEETELEEQERILLEESIM